MMQEIKRSIGCACLAVAICLVVWLFLGIFDSFNYFVQDAGTVFPKDRELFIPIDKGTVLDTDAYALADRNTGVIYIYTNGALSPLYDKEGNLIIYER